MDMKLECSVDLEEFIWSARQHLSDEEISNFITDLDADVGDRDFTENLIKRLLNSLHFESEELEDFLNDLRKSYIII